MWAAKNMRRNLGLSKRATCIFFASHLQNILDTCFTRMSFTHKTVMFVIENTSVFSGLKGFFDILWHQFVRNCYSIRPRQIHSSMNKTTQHFWREWLANGWWMAGEFSGSMAPGPARSATIGSGEGYAQCDRWQPQTISWSSWTCELVSRWVFRLFSLAKASSLLQDDVSMRFKYSDCNMSICLHIFRHVLVLCNMLPSTLVQACCLMQSFEDTDPHQLSEGITTRSSHLRFASKKDQRTCAKKKTNCRFKENDTLINHLQSSMVSWWDQSSNARIVVFPSVQCRCCHHWHLTAEYKWIHGRGSNRWNEFISIHIISIQFHSPKLLHFVFQHDNTSHNNIAQGTSVPRVWARSPSRTRALRKNMEIPMGVENDKKCQEKSKTAAKLQNGCRIGFVFFGSGVVFECAFFPGTICLVFATIWNQNLSFSRVFATFDHVRLPFCNVFATFGHVRLPFCMVSATFWYFKRL